ncbi:MAG: 16S rRNA (adenine(1518)-N(6)/adenine(1519)-N(6))-dimethyltransferase RsmA [Bacteroidales bacterium]|nr:16S rRNA (adenine(1518)-N(6)/adenine(1519)-N(6))-dimethyltransferase RsmA [Bacteroidales bacterium]
MNEVRPKKYLGQHFLCDDSIAQHIVESLQTPNPNVLEIGPGMGVLTQFLVKKENIRFQVVEIDDESVAYLQQHFPELRERIWAKDFLKLKLDELFDEPLSIIGNFPYNISSQILFKILEHKDLVTETVGMFQKEVAERIASQPGKKMYGILSVLLQAFFDIEYLFTVHENSFNPPPKVKSAVIRMVRNPEKRLHCDEHLFKQVVKTAFNQRRKTLRNSLKPFDFQVGFQENTLLSMRPEQLSVAQFEEICSQIIPK